MLSLKLQIGMLAVVAILELKWLMAAKGNTEDIMADHSEFARRLKRACDDNPVVPEKGKGQQVWMADKLQITQEAVRKYFEGINRPKPPKMKELAKLLGVDESWLALGIHPEMDGRKLRQYQSKAEAATYLAFGTFMANGYTCAFGQEGDDKVDFYAIKGGQQKAISVTTGRERSKSVWLFPVKTTYEETLNIVMLPLRPTQFELIYLDHSGIREHGEFKGVDIEIGAHRDARIFSTGRHIWKRLEDADVL
jgi:transcriptional regulator with XRE-family HTH domain